VNKPVDESIVPIGYIGSIFDKLHTGVGVITTWSRGSSATAVNCTLSPEINVISLGDTSTLTAVVTIA